MPGRVAGERQAILLDAFGLDNARRRLGGLSNGQRRAVSIVAAASVPAPLLLVDEATAALDPEAVLVLREVIRARALNGGAVLIATQDLKFSAAVATRIALLDHADCSPSARSTSCAGATTRRRSRRAFIVATGRENLMEDLRECLAAN